MPLNSIDVMIKQAFLWRFYAQYCIPS